MEQKQIAAIILVVAILAVTFYIYTDTTSATINVQGNSVIKESPDKVVVYFRIEAKNDSAEIAKNKVAEIENKITEALYFAGIDKEQITTEHYSIYEEYIWENEENKPNGYVATQTLKVETNRFDKAGRIIDLGVDNGALVSYINFEISEERQNQLKTQALEQASQDARAKAKGIAKGLGKRLGKVVSINTNDYNYRPYPVYEMRLGATTQEAKVAVTDINPDEIEIRGYVTVTFKIW